MTLRAQNISLNAGSRILLRDFNLSFARGELWAVLGQNGSGKTTLLHTLTGLAMPALGLVSLHDKPIQDWSRRALAREAGILLQQESEMFWGSVREYVTLGRYAYGDADATIVNDALATFDLETLAAHAYQTLSGGERQRARLAQLYAQNAGILLLDEPTQHLDLKHQQQFFAYARNAAHAANKTVIIILHDIKPALQCDRALLLYGDGRSLALATSELNSEILSELYGCEVSI